MTLNERKQKFMLSFLKQFLSNLAIIVFCNGLFCILQQYSNYSNVYQSIILIAFR